VWLLVSRSKAENQKTYQGSGLILMLLFFKAPCRADTPEECAAIIGENLKVGLQSGILIGVPIPSQDAAMADAVESAIQTSLMETKVKHITGAEVTPYILMRVNELTGGASLSASILTPK
jgi:pseudouridine-5'-phosphate glycosidase